MHRPDADLPPWLLELLYDSDPSEGVEIEYKRAAGGLPNNLWETVSAFANTRGGRIVLGVNEKAGYAAEGVPNVNARQQDLWNALRNPQKLSSPICSEGDVTIIRHGEASLLTIRVPAAPRTSRPVYINGNPYLGTYVRRHSGDYRCSKPEVDRMIREASGETADAAILHGYALEDLDRQALAGYRNRFQNQNPTSPKNELGDWAFLRALGAVARNRATGDDGLTVAGLLMFGQPETIRGWRSRHLIEYRLLPGSTDAHERWLDRTVWEGHLYGAFFTIFPALTANLPTPFELQGEVRSGESPVHIALREALVNLLVHADYAESDASLILRSNEGFLFRNPGTSRVPEDDMLIGNRSDPRNPALARMFRQIGLAEEAGTGIPKIVQLWRRLGFQLPEIRQGGDRYEFNIELRYAHLISDEDRGWLQSIGDQWTEEEQLALVLAKHEGMVDNHRLRGIAGLHAADATIVLGKLRQKGLLEPQGSGPRTWYRLGREHREDAGLSAEPTAAIAPSQWANLWMIAQPVREKLENGRRPRRGERDRVLVDLCRHAPLSLEHLEQLLGYTRSGIRGIVQELVKQNAIAYLHPERPTHPQQRYVVSPDERNAQEQP